VERVDDCTEDPLDESVSSVAPCYRYRYTADVFDATTWKFLGEVELPGDTILHPVFIGGETIVAAVEDAAGTIRVKRYRLVLPGEQ